MTLDTSMKSRSNRIEFVGDRAQLLLDLPTQLAGELTSRADDEGKRVYDLVIEALLNPPVERRGVLTVQEWFAVRERVAEVIRETGQPQVNARDVADALLQEELIDIERAR